MGARRRTRQGLSIHVESVLGKGISMQIETVAKEGFLPVRVHPTDAGADLRADIPEPVTLQPRESTFFNTGIEVAIPEGDFGALAIRSSLACKHGLAYIAGTGLRYEVGPFETTIEGDDYDQLMDIVKECQYVAVRAGAKKVSAYVKVVYRPEGEILSIDQKIGKYKKNK